MLPNNECFSHVKQWLSQIQTHTEMGVNIQTSENVETCERCPEDGVSNLSTKSSQNSNKSSASSAKLKAAAERAAVLARVKILKERHAIEEEEESLRRRKEMLDLEAELAAFEAKIEIYDNKADQQPQANSNMKGTCDKTGAKIGQALNPNAQKFTFTSQLDNYKHIVQQQEREIEVPLMENRPLDVRPKQWNAATMSKQHLLVEANDNKWNTSDSTARSNGRE